jgi:DnaJ-class molecular chaperone
MMVELDATCPVCQERGVGVYRMAAVCSNCGTDAVLVCSRGHRTWEIRPRCPVCGCSDWLIRAGAREKEA